MSAEVMGRLAYLRDRFPGFWRWFQKNGDELVAFDPTTWSLGNWARNLTPEVVAGHYGRPLPRDFFTLLRAACFVRSRRPEQWEVLDGLGVLVREAAHMVLGQQPGFLRYEGQPEAFLPIAQTGCDGESYNLYFDGDDYVVAFYAPMDFECEVSVCYTGIRSWLTAHLLEFLAAAEKPDWLNADETYLEAAAVLIAFDLHLPQLPAAEARAAEMEAVRQLVAAGRFPELKRWMG